MKNLLKMMCVVLALALSSSAFAQSTIGLRGGATLATFNDDPFDYATDVDKGYMLGADIALFSTLHVTGPFSIQPEFHWMQKGVKYTTTTSDDMKVKMTYRYDYLELPVLARFDFGDELWAFNVFAGPSAGYALNAKYIGENAPYIGSEDPYREGTFEEDIDWVKDYDANGVKDNRFDFSAVFGMGVEIKTEVVNFLLDARYNHDFVDHVRYENTPDPEPDKYYNRGFAITAGFAVPFGTF